MSQAGFSFFSLNLCSVVENTNFTDIAPILWSHLEQHPLPSTMSYVDLPLHDHQRRDHITPSPFWIPDSIPISGFVPTRICACMQCSLHCTHARILVPIPIYSGTSLIRTAWDQSLFRLVKFSD